MASSYPPPPTAGSGGISSPPTTQPQLQPHSPHPLQAVAHSQFDSNAAVAAANAAVTAHHGLQALQAATAIPSPTSIQNSVLGQFAGPADPSYLPANGSPDLITGDLNTKNHKHTRLGRACDLCSQRKVKVWRYTFPASRDRTRKRRRKKHSPYTLGRIVEICLLSWLSSATTADLVLLAKTSESNALLTARRNAVDLPTSMPKLRGNGPSWIPPTRAPVLTMRPRR